MADNTRSSTTRKGIPCHVPTQVSVETVNGFKNNNGNFLVCTEKKFPFTVADIFKYCLLTLFIFFGLSRVNTDVADTPSTGNQCATFVPIKAYNLTALCEKRAIDNIDKYRFTILSGEWEINMEYCERDLIKYLTYKFLSPHHAKEFNKNFDKAMELQSDITMQFFCDGFTSCSGSIRELVISSYVSISVRTILYAVVKEINERTRQNICNNKK